MAITFVGSGIGSQGGQTSAQFKSWASLAFQDESGAAISPSDGDFMICVCSYGGTVSRTQAQLMPTESGWTAAHAVLYANDSNDTSLQVCYKFINGDTGVTIPGVPAIGQPCHCEIICLRGVDPTTPIDVTTVTATGVNGSQADPPSITPTTAGAWIACVGASAAGTGTNATRPTGIDSTTNHWRNIVVNTSGIDITGAGGVKSDWSSGAFDCPNFANALGTSSDSWAAVSMAIRPQTAHVLTSTNIETSAPAIATGTLGVKVALTATNIATSAPGIATAAIAQTQVLTASNLVTSAPALATSSIAQTQVLGSTNLATAAPALATSTIAQTQVLTASNLSTAAPAIADSTIAQVQLLTATNLSTAAPQITSPVFAGVVALTSTNLATTAPSIGTRTIGQAHNLAPTNLATSSPALATPSIAQVHALGASNITTAAPALQTATATRVVNLVSVSIVTIIPSIAASTLGQAHNLAANGLSTVAPAIGPPSIAQVHALAATSTATAAPAIQTGTLGQAHILSAGTTATASPAIATATIQQVQVLTATAVTTAAPSIAIGSFGVILTTQMFARPIVTSDPGGWTTETGGTNLAASIDEAVPDDLDYIQSAKNTANDVARIKFGFGAPVFVRDVTLRYRLRRVGSNAGITQTVRLYEGGGNVVGAGTLVAGPFVHNVTAPTTFEQAIAASAIGNAQDLYLEVEAG